MQNGDPAGHPDAPVMYENGLSVPLMPGMLTEKSEQENIHPV